MLIPTKYEDINYNLLVIGANTIRLLKIKPYNVENLFQKLKHDHNINLEQFFNALTFLWLAEIINVDLYQISLNSNK
jgi:hypothetical protein